MLEITLVDDDGIAGRLQLDSAKVERFTRLRPTVISIIQRFRPERRRVESFLEEAYADAFGGVIREHYPTLMSVWDAEGRLHAAAGFRLASQGPLFLEQYLDDPVESSVAQAFEISQPRARIAEIGNLASRCPGASVFLFFALAGYLDQLGCEFACATATSELARMFRQVGFETRKLADASADRLAAGAEDWGDYYDHSPVVLAGRIFPAFEPLRRRLTAEPTVHDHVARIHAPLDEPQ